MLLKSIKVLINFKIVELISKLFRGGDLKSAINQVGVCLFWVGGNVEPNPRASLVDLFPDHLGSLLTPGLEHFSLGDNCCVDDLRYDYKFNRNYPLYYNSSFSSIFIWPTDSNNFYMHLLDGFFITLNGPSLCRSIKITITNYTNYFSFLSIFIVFSIFYLK